MPANLLDRLDGWKHRYGSPDTTELVRLLEKIALRRFTDPPSLIRLHETLLFLRAYPHNPEIARLADDLLSSFATRIGDPAFEEPEISGIAGTSFSAIFSYEVARRLAARYPNSIDIDWDRFDKPDLLGPALRHAIPLLAEDWPVEAHVPYRDWIRAARRPAQTDLQWLLKHVEGADAYESLQIPLHWELGNSLAARTHTRLATAKCYCHGEPLIRRSDVSLLKELALPPLTLTHLSRADARPVLDLILDTSAVRYRELYGFSHPDADHVYRTDAGRGVEIILFGVPRKWRLPLRTYSAAMFFKNGVPSGYVEVLSLFEQAEVGFNLYYTFREGESAWIYGRLLRLFNQTLGVNTFTIDPYQIGHENEEAIESGAFWFYRKLGFRSVDPDIARLTEREEEKIRAKPGYRSPARVLRRLAECPVIFEGPGAEPGAWDRFRVRNVCQALTRQRQPVPAGLNRTQQHRLRAAILKLGSY